MSVGEKVKWNMCGYSTLHNFGMIIRVIDESVGLFIVRWCNGDESFVVESSLEMV